MTNQTPSTIRYGAAAELLNWALHGDAQALNSVLQYLSSATPELRHIMQASLHDMSSPELWRALLSILATQHWVDTNNQAAALEYPLQGAQHVVQRVARAITEAFVVDDYEKETVDKETALEEAWHSPTQAMRLAAAYVRGLRGDVDSIPALDSMIDFPDSLWQLRAIEALGALHDERCGSSLVKALAKDRDLLHKAAHRTLFDMGALAHNAWIEALSHPDHHIRWHAARGLGQACDERGVNILVEGLLDENSAVRWATAGVLAQLDGAAVPAILQLIIHHPLHELLREALIHTLNSMASSYVQEYLHPLVVALHSPAWDIEAPRLAQKILGEWQPSHTSEAVQETRTGGE